MMTWHLDDDVAGESALDEDNEEEASINLNTMHQMYPDSELPWSVPPTSYLLPPTSYLLAPPAGPPLPVCP